MLEVEWKRLDRENVVEGSLQKTFGSHTWSIFVICLFGPVAILVIAEYYSCPLESANTPIDLFGGYQNISVVRRWDSQSFTCSIKTYSMMTEATFIPRVV